MNLLISEVLQKAHAAKTKDKKISILQNNASDVLMSLFIINFDDSVTARIPPGEVPYKPNDAPKGTEHTVLNKEGKKLYYFCQGGADHLPQPKVEQMYSAMLEGLHADEAQVVCKTFNKALHKKYRITLNTVKEAFPQIKWGGRGGDQIPEGRAR